MYRSVNEVTWNEAINIFDYAMNQSHKIYNFEVNLILSKISITDN